MQVPQQFWFGESEMSCVMAFFSIFKLFRWILDVVTINRISFNHRRTWNPFGKSLEENYLWLVLPGFKTAKILILAVFHSSYEGKAEHERRPAWLVTAEKLEGKSAWRTSGFLRNRGYAIRFRGLWSQPCRKSTKARAKPRNEIQKCSVGVILIMLPHILWKLRGCESIIRFLPNIDSKWIF